LVSSIDSDLAVQLAVLGAQVTAFGAALMLAAALLIRRSVQRTEAARRQVADSWRPILTRIVLEDGTPAGCPAPKRSDLPHVLGEWNAMQDAVRGDGTERLNAFARTLGLDVVALRMLRRGSVRARIVAIRTIGHLREGAVWDRLETELTSPNALASFCAASAMVRIDARRAMPIVMAQLAGHEHWPAEALARLLKEAGSEAAREPLRAFVFSGAHPAKVASVLQWLGRSDPTLAGEIAVEALRRGCREPIIVSKALLVLQDADFLRMLRPLARSPDLGVRKNLATAFGALGGPEDAGLLVELMGDRVWWVRYRAAQALVKLRGITPQRLHAIRSSLTDRFARDMLDQVLAEERAP
jgi:hypothetical protein